MAKASFEEKRQPMKIGTVPCLVVIHAADKKRMAPGMWVRIQEQSGDRWHKVLIEQVADGHIFASR